LFIDFLRNAAQQASIRQGAMIMTTDILERHNLHLPKYPRWHSEYRKMLRKVLVATTLLSACREQLAVHIEKKASRRRRGRRRSASPPRRGRHGSASPPRRGRRRRRSGSRSRTSPPSRRRRAGAARGATPLPVAAASRRFQPPRLPAAHAAVFAGAAAVAGSHASPRPRRTSPSATPRPAAADEGAAGATLASRCLAAAARAPRPRVPR
jgi:hypothetical protein